VNNPGQFAEYQHLTGKDQPVIDFFKDKSRIDTFLHDIIQTVTPSIDTYLQRGFKHLMVSFGCTGGQHRSVYCAQNFAEYVHNNFPVKVILCHREQNQMVTYENKMPEKRL
jgi:RNase adaptor protein for sRNA GlmZ degradation